MSEKAQAPKTVCAGNAESPSPMQILWRLRFIQLMRPGLVQTSLNLRNQKPSLPPILGRRACASTKAEKLRYTVWLLPMMSLGSFSH
jgi:hypothetical protein